MLLRLIDHLKAQGCTALFTSLTHGSVERATHRRRRLLADGHLAAAAQSGGGGERNRELYLLKSRGMAHSNQVREFVLSERGVELRPAYLGPAGVLTGSARVAQEARDRAAAAARRAGARAAAARAGAAAAPARAADRGAARRARGRGAESELPRRGGRQRSRPRARRAGPSWRAVGGLATA